MKDNNIKIPNDIWKQVESKSKQCQRAWGMGFPVISITLLKQILKREEVSKPRHSINNE